ncbi:short transient receptor potential channel 4-like isoform X2 [Paramacrobiotus metropolitanus]|uniref:short transient receptor potential channel 4-like isoform X2 n=1 Tax=Paramacrobiotus metropolitanus TaxID=2943436 RepID=UPI0024463FDD|nr:short transient receptor potential channel 4-like isoform X2 [Paramacrobiotus metropolitanus]
MVIPHLYVGDSLLHAIEMGNTEVVTLLLEGLRERDEQLEFKPIPDSPDYTPDMTPLMLAAHLDDFNMVKLLVDRGHKLLRPHPPDCMCGRLECSGSKGSIMTLLEYSKRRYNAYRALCSPAYITLSSRDVLKSCFKLCGELVSCASKEPELLQKYTELEEKLRNFAQAILEQCSTTDEVELILKQPHTGAPAGCVYPRIYLAIQCRQKEFIAHENCQQVLRAAWLDDWQDWRGMSSLAKLFRILSKLGLFTLITVLHLVSPHSLEFVQRFMRPPIHRYVISTLFYLAFLLLLFIETNHDRDPTYRGPPRSGLEVIIVLYIVGSCWEFSKTWQNQGSKTFLAVWWNWYEALNLMLFFTTFSIWYWAFLRAGSGPKLSRMQWQWNEPVLIAEGLFGFATILAFGRLLQIFRIDRKLGPLLISIGKMSFQMARFFVVYCCVMLSFATGLNHLYEAYEGQVRANSDGSNLTQSDAFMTFPLTGKTLFWTLFGRAPGEAADVIIGNRFDNGTVWKDYAYQEHSFTQLCGYIIFGLYHVVAILMLLNTLIAVMSNAFNRVDENSDMEWKFARAQIWISYFDSGHVLPPPFNLIPSLSQIKFLLKKILKRDEINLKEAIHQRRETVRYSELQQRLIQAVFAQIEKEKSTDQLAEIYKCLQKVMQKLDIS